MLAVVCPKRLQQLEGGAMHTQRILLVDDYPAVLESFGRLLRHDGFIVEEATTGRVAIEKLRSHPFDLLVLDWRLTDMTGLEVASAMNDYGVHTPWILISGFMDFDIAREAGRLGALKAVSPPIDIRDLVTKTLEDTRSHNCGWAWRPPFPLSASTTAAERWAALVLHACESDSDLPTIAMWAVAAGVCETTIYATCKVLKLHARAARDFARVLRALRVNGGRIDDLEAHLAIADPRTWQVLRDRAGLRERQNDSVIAREEFLRSQTFVPQDNCGLIALRTHVAV
jgi:two-component system, response regulator, stage 0 sporulation protein F